MQEQGFILSFVLLLLSLMGLYVLTLSELFIIQTKTLNSLSLKHQHFYAQEQAVQRLLAQSPNNCLFLVPYQRFLTEPLTFKTCQDSDGVYQFRYIWIDLGMDTKTCVRAAQIERAAHHYRLLVWGQEPFNEAIEVHDIKLALTKPCHKQAYQAKPGPSSWRILSRWV